MPPQVFHRTQFYLLFPARLPNPDLVMVEKSPAGALLSFSPKRDSTLFDDPGSTPVPPTNQSTRSHIMYAMYITPVTRG